MAQISALDTLIELATGETDEAAKRLGLAIRGAQDAEQKLAMLLQYRDDYCDRFRLGLSAGISATAYRNFQLFLDKLDTAIDGQQRIVLDAKTRINTERSAWQVCEHKRVSYDTLAVRAERENQRREGRREQKQMDEYANRQLYYKR